jgi:class 3 adenylate cyclase
MQRSDPGGATDSTPTSWPPSSAMSALEGQRVALGDDVVETTLGPLRERRATLLEPRAEQRRTLDPEDTREVVNADFALWSDPIEVQGGTVETFIGDAVMAVFGLRHSFEDDTHRAVRAALLAMTPCLPEGRMGA